jgi:hypothetical protein
VAAEVSSIRGVAAFLITEDDLGASESMGIETTFLESGFKGLFPLITELEFCGGLLVGPWTGTVIVLGAPQYSYSGFVGVTVAAA